MKSNTRFGRIMRGFQVSTDGRWRAARVLAIAMTPLMWVCDTGAQTAKVTTYTYDPLGRLTFVEDSQNGNRDYDYDKAGNRLNVAVGTANDGASSPPTVAVPGNRLRSQVANCAWRASWTLVPNARSYTLKNTQNQTTTVYPINGGSNPSVDIVGSTMNVYVNCPYNDPSTNQPGSVSACDSESCSAYGSF
jgi:YD repeat-containing protein